MKKCLPTSDSHEAFGRLAQWHTIIHKMLCFGAIKAVPAPGSLGTILNVCNALLICMICYREWKF
jgi:hypothetical protein